MKHSKKKPEIKITKDEVDRFCLRMYAGGNEKLGYYLSYRGDLKEAKKTLKLLNVAFQKHKDAKRLPN